MPQLELSKPVLHQLWHWTLAPETHFCNERLWEICWIVFLLSLSHFRENFVSLDLLNSCCNSRCGLEQTNDYISKYQHILTWISCFTQNYMLLLKDPHLFLLVFSKLIIWCFLLLELGVCDFDPLWTLLHIWWCHYCVVCHNYGLVIF